MLHLFVVATQTLMCVSLCNFVVIMSCFYTKKMSEKRCKCVQNIYIYIYINRVSLQEGCDSAGLSE